MNGFQYNLTPNNYQELIATLTVQVAIQFEKAIFKTNFSRVGFSSFKFNSSYQRSITLDFSWLITFYDSFEQLGALQLDKELRALITYLSAATTWTIRDRFTRLTQIVTILNLESLSEISEYWGPNTGSITWRLTPSEVRKILALRWIQILIDPFHDKKNKQNKQTKEPIESFVLRRGKGIRINFNSFLSFITELISDSKK